MGKILLSLCLFLMGITHAVAAEKVYRVGVDAPYPPFAYIDEATGELTGFDVDIAKSLCAQIKITCDVVVVPFDELLVQIAEGKIDVAVAGMVKKPEREKFAIFTEKYFRSSSLFIELPGSVEVSREGLKGKKIAVQAKTTQEEYLQKTYGDIAAIIPLKSFEDIIQATINKQVDVAFIDGLPGYHWLKGDGGLMLEIVGEPVTLGNSSRIAVSKSLPEIRDALDKGIQEIRANGEYDRVNRKYFEFNIY